jgi:hypothetical protein
MAEDDEFAGRDAKGLTLEPHRGLDSDAKARRAYWNLYGKLCCLQMPAVAWPVYFAAKKYTPLASRLAFAHAHGLGWAGVAWYVIYLARIALSINANACRAAARVGRPDQHVYRLMAADCDDQPFVLMVTTGAAGRWNRAQRACFNTDESLPVFLSGLVLVALVYGPVAVALAAVNAAGRVAFARLYTESADAREAGFLPAIVAEHLSAALVLVAAIKALAGDALPF